MGDNNREYVSHPDEKGSINISEEVIAVIAANAALDTEGVVSLSSAGGKGVGDKPGRRSSVGGVRLYVEDEIIVVDVWIIAKMGVSVSTTAAHVQEAVTSNIESMTGFSVSEVNVHVCGIAAERSK